MANNTYLSTLKITVRFIKLSNWNVIVDLAYKQPCEMRSAERLSVFTGLKVN
jgi:hypothetical protein